MTNASDSMLVEFLRYNAWANGQLLQACEALSHEQLAATAPGTYGTIGRTLEHLVNSEAHYLSLLTGEIRAYGGEVGSAVVRLVGVLETAPRRQPCRRNGCRNDRRTVSGYTGHNQEVAL